MDRYHYNPMRYDYSKVPLNIPNLTNAGSTANTSCSDFVMPNTNTEAVGQEENFSPRRNEYNEICDAYTTYQKSDALRRATQNFFNGDKGSESYLTQYGKKLEDFGSYIDRMTPEEYNESFRKLTGMTPDEYRQEKAQNPDFKLNIASVLETKEKNAHIQVKEDCMDYGKENVERMADAVIQQKQANLKDAKDQYDKEVKSENAWNRDLNDICEFLNVGTTHADVKKTHDAEDKNIAAMKEAINSGDLEQFAVHFKEKTGNDFKVENFKNLADARNKYNAAEENSAEKEQLRNEYEKAIKTAFGDNISQEAVDSYITTKHVSEGVAKGALIVGATIATGGIAGAAAAGVSGGVMALGASATTATIAGGIAGAAVTTGAATAASAGYDYVANQTSNEPNAETGKNAAEIASYTSAGAGAAGLGRAVSKVVPGGYGKVLGIATEIAADAGASYGISKGFGKETTIAQEGVVSAAANLVPRIGALGAGAKSVRATAPKVKNSVMAKVEQVSPKYIEQIKKERPHLSDEMALMHAKRLQRVSEGKTPWEEGPVNAYDREVHQKFYETKAGQEDFKAQAKKIMRPEDKLMPVQKRELTEHEQDLLDAYYREGSSHLSEDDQFDLCDLVRRSKPLDQDYTVYRTVTAGRFNKEVNSAFIDELKEGTVITRSDWTSTATKYDWACLQFHPDCFMSGSGGKGYVMRMKLPKGTKGLDLRGTDVLNGKQSEFMLPPNSQIKVNKIDHTNQIIDCEYIVPKTEDYIPNEAFNMKLSKVGKYSSNYDEVQDVMKTSLTYPNRRIEEFDKYAVRGGNMVEKSVKTDTITRPDGSTVTVTTDQTNKSIIEKVVRDKNGKVIFKDTIKPD